MTFKPINSFTIEEKTVYPAYYMNPQLYAIGSVILVSLVSLVGIVALSVREQSLKKVLHLVVALAAGALLGDAFIHLIPEALEKMAALSFSAAVLGGMVIFFILEKVLRWHHHHNTHENGHPEISTQVSPLGPLILIADGVHNFVDGIVIGASYLVSIPAGIATTLAVFLHEIPQEISDFSLLLFAGYSRKKALLFNFLSALTAVIGTVLALLLGGALESFNTAAAAVTAGGFIYIAAADLVPELHEKHSAKDSLAQLLGLILGIGAMFLLVFLET